MAKNNGKETSLDMAVTEDGTVVLQFSSLIKEVRFTPEQATHIGVGLIQWATRADSLRRVEQGTPRRKM
jgi:hypothetical protein